MLRQQCQSNLNCELCLKMIPTIILFLLSFSVDGTGLLQDVALFRCLSCTRWSACHPHRHPPPRQTQTHLPPRLRLRRLRRCKECKESGDDGKEDGREGMDTTHRVSRWLEDHHNWKINGNRSFTSKMTTALKRDRSLIF